MASVTLTRIVRDGAQVRFRFGKRELEFADLAAAREFVRDTLGREQLEAVAVALCLARQPALGNVAALEGRTLAVDLTAANWGTVS